MLDLRRLRLLHELHARLLEVLGVSGSCAWMRSGSNERMAERILRHAPGEKEIGATVPR